MSEWQSKLGGKRLIFTVTSGRSGTHFLTRLLAYCPGVDVFHEELTHSYHTVLRAAQNDPAVARQFVCERKLPFIASCSQPIFVETSHLVCKGFLEAFLEQGLVPDLILLGREPRKIATSLYRLGTIPGRNEKALQFYLMPADPDVVSEPGWTEWSDYQLCYWHALEIERRQRVYGERLRSLGARVHACQLNELSTVSGYRRLLQQMELPSPGLLNWMRFIRNRQKRAGDFTKVKNQRALPDDINAQEAMLDSLFAKIDKSGGTAMESFDAGA